MNETERLRWLKRAVCVSVLAEMALCPRLWTSDRAFPSVPALQGLPDLPPPLTLLLTGLWVAALLGAGFGPRFGRFVWAAPMLGAVLVAFDLTRLQPWFYQALLLLAVLGFAREDEPESGTNSAVWSACAWVLATTYFWSGLQKANLAFADAVAPQILRPLGLRSLEPLWWVAPLFEASLGLLLLFPRTRLAGLVGAAALHAALLAALGPLGTGFNSVVWPWNVAMPIFAFLVFFRNDRGAARPALKTVWGKPLVALVALLPALSFLGLWDAYLSDALYSGRTRIAFLLFTERGARQLPPSYQPYLQRRPDRIGLDVARWSLAALNVPPYPELRYYRGLARRLQESGISETDIALVASEPMGLTDRRPRMRTFRFHDP